MMSHVDGRHPEMKDETALHRWSSSQHPAPQCNREKNTRQVPTEGDSTKSLATVLKPVKGMENKESLRNHHSPEEPEETRHLNVTGVPDGVLGQKRTPGAHKANWKK